MEKLERVLVSEDDARRLVAEAREKAAALRTSAAAQALRIAEESVGAAAARASAARDEVMRAAESEAAALLDEAREAREKAVATARGRLDTTAAALAARLKG